MSDDNILPFRKKPIGTDGEAGWHFHSGTPEPIITINPDGTIVYGPNYTPDAAAQLFWEAVGKANPHAFVPPVVNPDVIKVLREMLELDGMIFSRRWAITEVLKLLEPKP